MKRKKLLIIVTIFIIIITSLIFIKNHNKTANFGNNTNKSINDLKEYILNLNSYEAEITLQVTSNKTENKYKIIQKYMSPNIFYQEVLEPNSINGLITKYDGTNLIIENTHLNLSKIYENYPYLTDNNLCLSDFIKMYKQDNQSILEETENTILLKLKKNSSNRKDEILQVLEVSKETGKPISLTIEDKNEKKLVYILYNEIKINSLKKDDVLAFTLKTKNINI